MSNCDCFRCTGEKITTEDEYGTVILNNLCTKPCPDCGRDPSEHRDYVLWGELVCWWCNERTADLDEVPA